MPAPARHERIARVAPYALVGAASAYLYHVASRIEYHARTGVLGPDAWPKALLICVMALCCLQIVMALLPGGHGKTANALDELIEESADEQDRAPGLDRAKHHPGILLGGMAISALYVWSVTRLGFFTATVLYLVAFIWLGGYRRWGVIAAVSVIGTLLLLFFFMKVVYVSLPIGDEPFAQVTLLLMKLLGVR